MRIDRTMKDIIIIIGIMCCIPILVWLTCGFLLWCYPPVYIGIHIVNKTDKKIYYQTHRVEQFLLSDDTVQLGFDYKNFITDIKTLRCTDNSPILSIKDFQLKDINKDFDNENNWNIIYHERKVDCYFRVEL